MYFVWVSEQAIFSLYKFSWLVFTTKRERESVYYAVRPGSLSMIHINFYLQKPRQAVNSISGQTMWYLWWTQWHFDIYRCRYFGFPPSGPFHSVPQSHSCNFCSYRNDTRVNPGNPPKSNAFFGKRIELDIKEFSLFSFLRGLNTCYGFRFSIFIPRLPVAKTIHSD